MTFSKKNGRCAVVVSEGFLTWGQNSACSLRKILLNEANLRAVISLPQGVFVSKGGQGAKTSILYFEKGQPTDFVWYYKIENDGFSMGTNRKLIEGSQIPEIFKLFKEVKEGKKPQDTKHSFCISKEQIETLDPRVSERINKEITEKTKVKNAIKREKLVVNLDKKLKSKNITKEMYNEKLWQFDNIVEGQIDNEVAKTIEKAHLYHFNLQNYRSNLSAEQIKDWQETLKGVEIKNGTSIEKRYQALVETQNFASLQSKTKIALQILASFDPKNALQMDIAREYLSKLDKKVLEHNEKLKKLEEILRKGLQYPLVSLKDLIVVNNEKIKPLEFPETEFTVLGVSNQTGVFINEKLKGENIKQNYFKVYKNQFCYNPYRINVGSIGFCEFDIENQIISGAYNVFGCNESELNPKYLGALFKTKKFLSFVNEKANGGVRMDFKIGSMQEWQIPLPSLEIQNEIIEKIEKQKQIIEGAEKIENNFKPKISNNEPNQKMIEVGKICEFLYGDPLPEKERVNGEYPVFGAGNIIGTHNKYLTKSPAIIVGRRGATSGTVMFSDKSCWVIDTAFFVKVKSEKIDFKYLYYSLKNLNLFKFQSGGAMPGVNRNEIYTEKISLPSLETQHQIVEKLDRQMQALEGVRFLKSEAEKQIENILIKVWEGD
ncbi:restriction endonuclease subunit S [Candidatus Poribacteria bacterium]|nr:restriction endonuclease subunit S [Candidatus Poribacteria bacterium]